MDNETRQCENCKTKFIIEPDDFSFYQKMGVSPPTRCPRCRRIRRLSFRNDRDFYRRACDLCRRNIIALYPAESKTPVYCAKCWWSDAWNPLQYGQAYDPGGSFFEQCKEIFDKVPTIAMQNDDGVGSVNCEYTTDWWYSKNCYMAMCGWQSENVFHSYHIEYGKDVADSAHLKNCEWAYECAGGTKCSKCKYCTFCHDCHNCFLSYDLRGCSDCVMCAGLRNKQLCILNKQYSKEEYARRIAELKLESRAAVEGHQKTFGSFIKDFPRRYAQIFKSVQSTGDELMNCKNAKDCYFGNALENCKFIVLNDGAKETYDCNAVGHPELCYENITSDHSNHCAGTIFSVKCREVFYSSNCPGTEHLMGCAGLKKGSHAILNTQYAAEEYEKLKSKIIENMKKRGEWGEFFPETMTPFAYNESLAYEFDPLTREEAAERGFRWKEERTRDYKATLSPDNIPDTISEVKDGILNEIIGCANAQTFREKCTTAFRLMPDELRFYRAMDIPVPKYCPNCRHFARIKQCNPPRLYHRACMCNAADGEKSRMYNNIAEHFHGDSPCPNEFETSYSPERPEIVYCEDCYNAGVV
ncbi:MAG: hypothetical protein HYY10_03040 [Candidatus Liptonbacteria bacterium]|nr:hypothetical protein [Candidatus Liptonbacteria bacterium]